MNKYSCLLRTLGWGSISCMKTIIFGNLWHLRDWKPSQDSSAAQSLIVTDLFLHETEWNPSFRVHLKFSLKAEECCFLHVVHVAGIRHLLDVNSRFLLAAGQSSYDPVFNHILQVGEAAPDVPHVFKRVRSRTGIPVSTAKHNHQLSETSLKILLIFSIIRNACLLPILDLVGALHVIDVHADLVVDVGRQVGRVGLHVRKHYPSPKLAVIQQMNWLVYQALLISHRLQLIQVHTLQGRMKINSLSERSRGQADRMMQFWQSKKSGPVYTII